MILHNPKIQRDPETGASKGFAFVSYANFEASDAAIKAMNGQYLSNRNIRVNYAFKKDTKCVIDTRERERERERERVCVCVCE